MMELGDARFTPESGDRPRRSLVLAGGGMRVAYQAGVLRALAEAGLTFGHGDGASGGIINLAMLMSGQSTDEMCERWQTLNPRDFVSLPPLRQLVHAPDLPAWGDAGGIVGKVFPHLGIDVHRIRNNQAMDGTFTVCNFSKKTIEAIPHTDVDMDFLVAGISLPILMPAVRKRGSWYSDAVWIKDANVMEAVRRGADEIWLVWCIGNTTEYHHGALQQYVHMIEMAANGSLFEQFERVEEINARIRSGEVVDGRTKPITLHVIKPALPLPLDPDYYLGRISGTTLVEMGYADAWQYLRTMRPDGVPWTSEATRMTEPQAGITFTETMAGDVAVDTTDPKALDDAPADRRHALAIHVTVAIDDIDRFVSDPKHKGRLTGHIDFDLFGTNIPASDGVFNLFSPSDDPTLMYMVYELGFRHEGKAYYLAGKKEVRDDPGFDLWADTTTLFTTVHEGEGPDGPVIAAGVLKLGMGELIKLARSMRATNAGSIEHGARVIGKFGAFFLRELWSSYGPKQGELYRDA